MCPGLTSKGGIIDESVEENDLVQITIEGKEHAIAIGQMRMSPQQIKDENKGMAIEVVTYLTYYMWSSKVE